MAPSAHRNVPAAVATPSHQTTRAARGQLSENRCTDQAGTGESAYRLATTSAAMASITQAAQPSATQPAWRPSHPRGGRSFSPPEIECILPGRAATLNERPGRQLPPR